MRALYWFRNDLRLHDNEALTWLCQNAQDVLFVYSYPLNFSRAGKFRRKFLLETLSDLQRQLEEHGHHLFMTYAHPEEVLPVLSHKYKMDTLVYTEEYTPEELHEEKQVLSRLILKNIVSFDQRVLSKKSQLPFEVMDMPMAFTEFRTAMEQHLNPSTALPVPLIWPKPIAIDEFEMDLNRELKMFTTPSRFMGGETQALQRLREYFWDKDLLKTYKDTRHGLLNFDDSSKFSPWLANGSLSPRQVFSEIKNYEKDRISNDSTYWMILDLLWRDYFKFYSLKYGPFMFRSDGFEKEDREPLSDRIQQELFKTWSTGTTGSDFVDASMKELNETGFMSNKGRRVTSNYLIHTMHVDWRKGARYFEEMLIDYDAASNWGNWNYSAGIAEDIQTTRRMENQNYTADPEGSYVRHWLGPNHSGSNL